MLLQPQTIADLRRELAAASARGERISAVDPRALNELVEHVPEDMTATVGAGMLLRELQEKLRSRGQWLPLDPPFAERTTVGEVLARNLSGPRRQGCGVARDYVIGLRVALASGEIIRAGGKVVKNVAGYDLCKLFIGARDSLGIIVEATFKLRPVPEQEVILQAEVENLEAAGGLIRELQGPGLEPVVLDLHNLGRSGGSLVVVAGFAGAAEDVEGQVARVKGIGFREIAGLEYEEEFWGGDGEPPEKSAVLPSKLMETLERITPRDFVARAGRGIIYYREGKPVEKPDLPWELMRRVKAAYDPKNILPEFGA